MASTPSNVLTTSVPQRIEPPPKRQKMSSVTSESTLADDTLDLITAEQVTHSVATEDLSSMVFHAADLQKVASMGALHHPVTCDEHAMKSYLKICEDTATNLRAALESLQPEAVVHASDRKGVSSNLHNAPKDDKTDEDNTSAAYKIKAAETQKFLVKAGIWKVVSEEFTSLSKFDAAYQDLTYDRWYQHREALRDKLLRATNEDREPLVDFEEKVRRLFQRDMMERVVSDVKRDLERQWKKYGRFMADT